MPVRSYRDRRARQITLYGAMLAAIPGVLVADLFQPALADAADTVRGILPGPQQAGATVPMRRAVETPVAPQLRSCNPRRGFESVPKPLTD